MPPFPIRRFRVKQNRAEGVNTFTLVLEPADNEPMFSFQAGQFVMVHLANPDGTPWAKAAYSIATAPSESKNSFELAIRIHGDFTKRCALLKVGEEIGIQGPYGAFVLKPETERLVFFGAGVGVTPLRSMIREALLTKKPIQIFLMYSDRAPECMAYHQEFKELALAYANFHPIFILTREQPENWDGESQRMNSEMIKKYVSDFSVGRYCMCGPNDFMESIKKILEGEGVDIKANLQRESFE